MNGSGAASGASAPPRALYRGAAGNIGALMDSSVDHSSVRIRPAGPGDLVTVQRLAHEIWHRHYPGILSTAQIDYMLARGYSRDALLPFVTDAARGLALAEEGRQPIGFAAWYRPDEPATLKLDKLYVLPDRHGSGVGRALIVHVAAAARAAGCRTLILIVNRGFTGAIRAFERCGFVVRETGDFPIGGGFVMEDYIMARPLEGA
jgi:GNAT superfamily N-acetyltransferase